MSKNFKFSGRKVTIANVTAAVASGSLTRQRGFIGIPETHGAAGASVSFALEGVWGMTFAPYAGLGSGPMPAIGSILYWDTSASALSNGSASDDYPAVKVVGTISTTDGSFLGMLLPQGRPAGQDQS